MTSNKRKLDKEQKPEVVDSEDERNMRFDKFLKRLYKKDTGGFSEPHYFTTYIRSEKHIIMGYSETQILRALGEACERSKVDMIREYWEEIQADIQDKDHEDIVEAVYQEFCENASEYDVLHVYGSV